jgi:hypothetical protein
VSPSSLAILALVVVTGLLLTHRTTASLKNLFTLLGIVVSLIGFSTLSSFWFEVEFTVFAEASTENCAQALGIDGSISELREQIEIEKRFTPPSVACVSTDEVRTLTPTSTTESLKHLWAFGWAVLCLGPLFLIVGLIKSKGWRKNAPEENST